MRKIISILGIIVLLGGGLLFLKPSSFERKSESKPMVETEKIENIGMVNPLLSFAMQATEPKLLDSLNKTSFDLLSKVRPAIVKITKNENAGYSLGCTISPSGLIVTMAKNLSKTAPIDILLPTGSAAKARWVGNDAKTGVTFLKLDGVNAFSMLDLNESFQTGDFLLVFGRDANLNTNVVLRANISGKLLDQSMIFYLPKFIDDAFIFNTQGQLLGIGAPLKDNRNGTMTAISASQINAVLKPLISQ